MALGEFVLDVVVRGAVAALEQACLTERLGSGADAGHRAAAGVVVAQGPQHGAPIGGESARVTARQPGTITRSSVPSSGQSTPATSGRPCAVGTWVRSAT